MYLTNAEEQIMLMLWRLEKGFIRDIINEFPDPKPAQTTVITLLKRMIDKGFVSYTTFGNSRQYYPLINKTDYVSDHFNVLIKDFFNNSTSQFASFFTNETSLTRKELEELKEMVEKRIALNKKTK